MYFTYKYLNFHPFIVQKESSFDMKEKKEGSRWRYIGIIGIISRLTYDFTGFIWFSNFQKNSVSSEERSVKTASVFGGDDAVDIDANVQYAGNLIYKLYSLLHCITSIIKPVIRT